MFLIGFDIGLINWVSIQVYDDGVVNAPRFYCHLRNIEDGPIIRNNGHDVVSLNKGFFSADPAIEI